MWSTDRARRGAVGRGRPAFDLVESFRNFLNSPFYRGCGSASTVFRAFELFALFSDFLDDWGDGVGCSLLSAFDPACEPLDALEYGLHRWRGRRCAPGWRRLSAGIARLRRRRLTA